MTGVCLHIYYTYIPVLSVWRFVHTLSASLSATRWRFLTVVRSSFETYLQLTMQEHICHSTSTHLCWFNPRLSCFFLPSWGWGPRGLSLPPGVNESRVMVWDLKSQTKIRAAASSLQQDVKNSFWISDHPNGQIHFILIGHCKHRGCYHEAADAHTHTRMHPSPASAFEAL